MKYIIFGTGIYYQHFRQYIPNEDILYFIDNNWEKQGNYLDGKLILSPDQADFNDCSYVIVLIMRYQESVQQLLDLGVPKTKIKIFYDIGQLFQIDVPVHCAGDKMLFSDWIKIHQAKKVLVVTHELTRTGVPVVLMHVAMLLKRMGYDVVLSSLFEGGLTKELQENQIDFIPNIGVCYRDLQFVECIADMDFVILGTIGLADVAKSFIDVDIPIMWWMHESVDKYFRDCSLAYSDKIHYYGGGKRVLDCFYRYYPDRVMKKLLYFLPEESSLEKILHNTYHVAVIGMLSYRKAQDIYVSAVSMIPVEVKNNVTFDIIGAYEEPIIDVKEVMEKESAIRYLGELTQKELEEYYCTLDLLVCPSRDDPMPVVVTQAMQYGIPCIVSDQVGQSEYIISGENGFVFPSENVEMLSEILLKCLSDKEAVSLMGKRSRKIYQNYFSEEAMQQNLQSIIEEITC